MSCDNFAFAPITLTNGVGVFTTLVPNRVVPTSISSISLQCTNSVAGAVHNTIRYFHAFYTPASVLISTAVTGDVPSGTTQTFVLAAPAGTGMFALTVRSEPDYINVTDQASVIATIECGNAGTNPIIAGQIFDIQTQMAACSADVAAILAAVTRSWS